MKVCCNKLIKKITLLNIEKILHNVTPTESNSQQWFHISCVKVQDMSGRPKQL